MAKRWSKLSSERISLGLRRYLGAVGACIRFLLLYPWFRPGETNRFSFGVQGLQDELAYRNAAIPARHLWEIFPGINQVEVTIGEVFPDEGSSISLREMAVLCALVRHERAVRVFEIGTSLGVTAYNIARNLPEGGLLHTLDLPPARPGVDTVETKYEVTVSDRKMIFAQREHRRFISTSVENKIQQLYGDSATFDYSPYHASCNIVFVDGAHAYPYVESDTLAAFQIVKPGGLVLWHDYNDGFFWPDVHRYLNEFAKRHAVQRIRSTMFAVARVAGTSRR